MNYISIGGQKVLRAKLSFKRKSCELRAYEHTEECAGEARATQDEKLRADYLRLAQGWLKLARSYDSSD